MEATPLSAFKITGTRIDGFIGEGIAEVVIPEGITEIQHHAFCPSINPAASAIRSVYIPDTVIRIGQSAFASATNLVTVRLPNGLKKLEAGTFSRCENLNSICLPYGLQTIGFHAFASSKISEIILPDSVTKLEDGAIAFCHFLKTITVPQSVIWAMGQKVFYYSNSLTIQTTSGSFIESYAKDQGIPVKIISFAAMDELLTAQKNSFPKYPQLDKPASGKSDQNASKFDDMPDALREALEQSGLTIDDLLKRVNELVPQKQAKDTPPEKNSTDQYVSPRLKEIEKQIAELGQTKPAKEKEKKHGSVSLVSAGKKWLNRKNMPTEGDKENYSELIRIISFIIKIAPLADFNFNLSITYEHKDSQPGVSQLYVNYRFCDFNEIQFAREQALSPFNPVNPDLSKMMVQHYYNDISKRAGLSQQDWPFAIDAEDFGWVFQGKYADDLFTVIPDQRCDDIFTLKMSGGDDSRNAQKVCTIVSNLLKEHFPDLPFGKAFAHPQSMRLVLRGDYLNKLKEK